MTSALSLSTPAEGTSSDSSQPGRVEDVSDRQLKRANLKQLREMKERSELQETCGVGFEEELPPGFWDDAELVMPKPPKSVHLKVDAEVFDFFKAQGKGHLTRMQNGRRAYGHAQKRR